MKFISALILVSAFAFTSAQLGVKGGVSSGSSGLRSGSFFPRLAPGSIQEKKDQLQFANVDDVVVGGGVSSTGAGFVQPVQTVQTVQPVQPVQTVQTVAQPENVFTVFQQERPTQSVLVPSSGSVSSVGSVPVSTSVGPQSQVVPVRSNFGYFDDQTAEIFVGNPVGLAQPAPGVQTFQSFAPLQAFRPSYFERPVQQLVQFGAGPVVPSFPSFAQNIAHFAPQPQVGTVQTVPTLTQTSFVPSSVSSGKVGKQVVAPAATSQPASFPTFSSFSVPSVVPSFQPSNGLVVPTAVVDSGRRFAQANLPTSVPTSGQVNPTFSSKIFTDNRISTPGVGVSAQQQQFPSVISQEKQSAETVQTTEW